MMFKTYPPRCHVCGKFIKQGECITDVVNYPVYEPEFFEDLNPYCKACWDNHRGNTQ